MWVYQQPEPGRFAEFDAAPPDPADLADDELLLEFRAGGICGSDIPKFLGHVDPDLPTTGQVGVPLHELIAVVVASTSPEFAEADRVVCHVPGARGLQERLIAPAENAHRLGDGLSDVEAVMVQPLSTVLSALDRIGPVEGKTVAVVGLGPLGLLFCHVAHSRAARVIGVDRVSRAAAAASFGIDEFVQAESRRWASSVAADGTRPDVVIDAVGHQQEILADAVQAISPGGEILIFGLPEDHYVLPMRDFFRKGLRMTGGTTKDWPRYLKQAEKYVCSAPELPGSYITDVRPRTDLEAAYRLYTQPATGRHKVVITA